MRLSTRELQALCAIMGERDPAACVYLFDDLTTDLQRKGCVAP
jgi:hypothetical protein